MHKPKVIIHGKYKLQPLTMDIMKKIHDIEERMYEIFHKENKINSTLPVLSGQRTMQGLKFLVQLLPRASLVAIMDLNSWANLSCISAGILLPVLP